MLEPALPSFATVGDKLIARAVLRNSSTTSGDAEVTLRLDDKTEPATPLVRRLTIEAGGSAAIDFPVEFKNPGMAHWIWSARLNAGATPLTDAVQSDLPVGFAAPILREILTDRTQATESNLLASANPQFLEGTGRFQVSVANTRLLGLIEPVAYLLHYPYGCAEQTISNMLPWIAAPQLRQAVPGWPCLTTRQRRRLTSESAGSWKCKPTKVVSVFGRTIANRISGRARMVWSHFPRPARRLASSSRDHQQGLRLSEGRIAELRRSQDNFELSDRCLALYALALAGRPENSYHEVFFNKRARLSGESRAACSRSQFSRAAARRRWSRNWSIPTSKCCNRVRIWFGSEERELAVRPARLVAISA